MNIEELENLANKINKTAAAKKYQNGEELHAEEDKLMQNALDLIIRTSTDTRAIRIAMTGLSTRETIFDRWCA